MSGELIIHSPRGVEKRIAVEDVKTIGRDAANDITLDDDLASRNHAMVRCQDDNRYFIVDLGSSNGTFVNGKPITVPTLITPLDEILIGETQLEFRNQQAQKDVAQPPSQQSPNATVRNFVLMTMSILVSDVRDFTPMTEGLPAETVSKIFADWFKRVGIIIEECGGAIEQFRGDSVMAYWIKKDLNDETEYAVKSVTAAKRIVEASKEYNDELATTYGEVSFAVGCGLSLGEAALGNIGSDARRDFTLMGDCVNVAFRIEGMCSKLDRSILLTKVLQNTVVDIFQFEDLGEHPLKGKTENEHIYSLPV